MTIDEQIENLKSLGLQIDNEEYAKRILNDISYFRLIKAFSLNLKPRNGSYHKDVKFSQIVELYLFNANFRQLLFPLIEKIEINARCRIGNYVSEHYGVLGYKDKDNFVDEEYHKQFMSDINEEIRRNLRAPFVKNFTENYEGRDLPMYALVEICGFRNGLLLRVPSIAYFFAQKPQIFLGFLFVWDDTGTVLLSYKKQPGKIFS